MASLKYYRGKKKREGDGKKSNKASSASRLFGPKLLSACWCWNEEPPEPCNCICVCACMRSHSYYAYIATSPKDWILQTAPHIKERECIDVRLWLNHAPHNWPSSPLVLSALPIFFYPPPWSVCDSIRHFLFPYLASEMSSLFKLLHRLHPYLVSLHPHTSTAVRLLWECFLSPLLSFPSPSHPLSPPPSKKKPLPVFFLSMSLSLFSGGFNALWKWSGATKAKQDKFGCLMWLLSLLICLIGGARVRRGYCAHKCLCVYGCTLNSSHTSHTESPMWATQQLVSRHEVDRFLLFNMCSWHS